MLFKDAETDAQVKARDPVELALEGASDSFLKRLMESEQRFDEALRNATEMLNQHKSDSENTRQQDKERATVTLDQRIAKWRAGVEDTRHSDMQEVASSIMDAGQAFMTIQKV